MDIKKYEYVLDIFKGTCELNNYKASGLVYKSGDLSSFKIFEDGSEKIYFTGLIYEEKSDCLMGAVNKQESNVYMIGEMINMACKFLANLDITEYIVEIASKREDTDLLISNLEDIDIAVDRVKDIKGNDDLSFSVVVGDIPVITGGVSDKIYFNCKYSDLEGIFDYSLHDYKTDVYLYPLDEESLNDAFIIGANLRDSGFKVQVDYSREKLDRKKLESTFLVSFGKEDIAKYEVKLIDLATDEVKTVGIDSLIEELAFL